MRKKVLNIIVPFLLAEWILPSFLANFNLNIPEASVRVFIFAVFIVGLLAMIAVSVGGAKAAE